MVIPAQIRCNSDAQVDMTLHSWYCSAVHEEASWRWWLRSKNKIGWLRCIKVHTARCCPAGKIFKVLAKVTAGLGLLTRAIILERHWVIGIQWSLTGTQCFRNLPEVNKEEQGCVDRCSWKYMRVWSYQLTSDLRDVYFLDMLTRLPMVVSESSFGAYVCIRRPAGLRCNERSCWLVQLNTTLLKCMARYDPSMSVWLRNASFNFKVVNA